MALVGVSFEYKVEEVIYFSCYFIPNESIIDFKAKLEGLVDEFFNTKLLKEHSRRRDLNASYKY